MVKENARNRRETGQTLVLFVLALGVIMGFTAMTVDVGMFFQERRSLQNAADAAALAGIQELP
ncbi:MAG: pilus assembly protein TadG-related protein, partial [Dehalococcoidia bacterium]